MQVLSVLYLRVKIGLDFMAAGRKSTFIYMYTIVGAMTLVGFGLLLGIAYRFPVLFGLGVLAYLLGLRHGMDVDHIIAIDNTTRKLIKEGKDPEASGFFFSLGHSTIVVLMVIVVVLVSKSAVTYLGSYSNLVGNIGTAASAGFLYVIAIMNAVILIDIFRKLRRKDTSESLPAGFMSRIFSRFFRSINSSWQLYPIGVLFGLGFDTATEIALLGIAATQAGVGIPIGYILVLPLLFTAGMTLVDSTDSLLMSHAYKWTLADRAKRVWYNVAITSSSVAAALIVATYEILQRAPWLFADAYRMGIPFAGAIVVIAAIGIAVLKFRRS